MEALRAEALQSVISRVEDRNFGGIKNRVHWGRAINPQRIALLFVALVAGGMAAYLATHRDAPAPAVVEQAKPVVEARTQILVAKQAIGMGERLSATTVEWEDWPEGAVRPDYVTIAAAPDALTSMSKSVARYEIFPGEPIRQTKIVQTDGYLSAVLDKGMRGVSVSVAAESASGGFIVPNDHVDVVLTRNLPTGQTSEAILRNVRVLAINSRLGETGATGGQPESNDPATKVFKDAIATLALDATQADVIINASTMGKLSLVLRSVDDAADVDKLDLSAANQTIRLTSPFWSADTAHAAAAVK